MKIVVACGGTGGHSYPGLAVAEELRRRGHEVVVWSSGRDIESSVMKGWTGPRFSTGARQISLKNGMAILWSIVRCRKEMRKTRPDALLAMGSYSSLPPVLAARSSGVPIYLHEANTIPGKAVGLLARFAKKVAISFDMTADHLDGVEVVKTGLPVRSEISQGKRFDFIPTDSFVVFVTGGSQGAHAVNELLMEALVMMRDELAKDAGANRGLYIIHQTGAKDESMVAERYSEAGIPARVHAFETKMADAFASADIVVARAGASTCFELAVCGKPALLIPLPTSMRDHQHFNAEAFAAKGAADEGVQMKLSPRQICRYLIDKYRNPDRLERMSMAMQELATPGAAEKVADMVEGKM